MIQPCTRSVFDNEVQGVRTRIALSNGIMTFFPLTDNYCACLPGLLLEFFTWLGYANSALNPIIYAVTMRSFGDTFKEMIVQLLCCDFWHSSFGSMRTGFSSRLGTFRTTLRRGSRGSSNFLSEADDVETGLPMIKRVKSYVSETSSTSGHSSTRKRSKLYRQPDKDDSRQLKKTRSFQLDSFKQSVSWMNLKLYQLLISSDCTEV